MGIQNSILGPVTRKQCDTGWNMIGHRDMHSVGCRKEEEERIRDEVSEKGREVQRIDNKNITVGNRKTSTTFMNRDLYSVELLHEYISLKIRP
jgi:hypothetical protein